MLVLKVEGRLFNLSPRTANLPLPATIISQLVKTVDQRLAAGLGTGMMMVVRMLTVASLVLAFCPSALRAAPSPALQSVFGFCKAHMTVDHPPGQGFGSPDNGGVPPELLAINADTWRCLDGQVLVCADSADGDQCARKSDDRHPRIVEEACHDLGNSKDVPFSAGHPYRYDWACRGGKAVIIKTYALDPRGFFQKAWAPLVIRDGVVLPTEAPEMLR